MAQDVYFEFRNTGLNRRVLTFAIVNRNFIDVKNFLIEASTYFINEVRSVLQVKTSVKANARLHLTMKKNLVAFENPLNNSNNDDESENRDALSTIYQDLFIYTTNMIIERNTNLSVIYERSVLNTIVMQFDDAITHGSGFTLSSINDIEVQINEYDPLRGSSYIRTPTYLANKKVIVNVQNKHDDFCFMWAILSAMHRPRVNAERISNYVQYRHELDFTGIDFPVQIKDICKFERINSSISINVYIFDSRKRKIQVLRVTKNEKHIHINLMLLTEERPGSRNSRPKQHYCWITDINKLVSSQISNHGHRLFLCNRCINSFWSQEKLNKHRIHCIQQNECQIELPAENEAVMEFKNYKNQIFCPFVIYADLEALLKNPVDRFSQNNSPVALQQHEAYSVGYYLKCSYDDTKSYYAFKRGIDCLDWFVKELETLSQQLNTLFNNANVPIQMTAEDEINFLRATNCHICEKKLFRHINVVVRDHCHFTGKFRGAAHQSCNLEYRNFRTIPVIFHNLTHYDAHFLIEKIACGFEGSVKVIPLNSEKYISFVKSTTSNTTSYTDVVKFKFIDSFKFMASSLDKLASWIPSEKKGLLRNEFAHITDERIHLLERKGVFCYDYVDSWEKLDERMLPSKESFKSSLTNEPISDVQYAFANEIWRKFNIQSLGEYADLYLRVDVCLLAIVFENFRETCMKLYKLDPANYYTTPGLAFDAMLKYTKVKLELLTNIDMVLFVERGIRGGISQCSKRYAEANNKYMGDAYNPLKKSSYIMYVDCNNLYGYAMMQHLPRNGFQWVENRQFTVEEILDMADDSSVGYYFEVDLKYPQNLHNLHNDYPFCAENALPPHTNCMNLENENSQRCHCTVVNKLLLTLWDKKKYVIHYRMLKIVLRHGLILEKIHTVLKFNQSAWLKPYIELNTNERMNARNDFEENLYKLMNNAIYGKTMENVRKRIDIVLRTKWEGRYGVRKLVARPDFKRNIIFNENLIAVEMNKTSIEMKKPIYIGPAVLDLSKVFMYEHYYDYLKPKYGDLINMMYTDTDSFILHIETDDFYKDILENLDKYDTSNYPINNIYNIPRVNNKVPGLFKDELLGIIITHYIGLRSKMYSIRAGGVDAYKKAKGVKQYVLKKEIKFEDFENCLRNNCTIVRRQNTFRTKLHKMFTISEQKIALSPFDDKRHILTCEGCENNSCAACNFQTMAHGHFSLLNDIE